MGMWEILEEGRDDYGRGFGMRGDEVEEAYKEGCRHGYENGHERDSWRHGLP